MSRIEDMNLPETAPLADPSSANGLRILIVEDYLDSALSLKLLLRTLGHDAEVAFNGPMALQIARKMEPDVVILDIGLPGMNGWEVAQRLQKEATLKRPFFIAVTGFGSEEDKKRSADVGVDLHLIKPVDPQELAAVLRRFQRVNK